MASSMDFEFPEFLDLPIEDFPEINYDDLEKYFPKNLTNDTPEFADWINYTSCSPSATTDTVSSYDSSCSPQSYSPLVNRSQSPTELEQGILVLNFDGEPIPSASQSPWGEDIPWDEDMDKLFNEDNDLQPYIPIPPPSPPTSTTPLVSPSPSPTTPTTPLVSPSPCPSGTTYSPQSSASPSPRKTSIGPIRRRKRAARSPNAPRNYPCTFPGCTTSCLRRCDLTKHSKRHTKPFSCGVCDARFSTVKDCERHELSKHQKENHLHCSFCQHSTARKDNLADHVRRKHS